MRVESQSWAIEAEANASVVVELRGADISDELAALWSVLKISGFSSAGQLLVS